MVTSSRRCITAVARMMPTWICHDAVGSLSRAAPTPQLAVDEVKPQHPPSAASFSRRNIATLQQVADIRRSADRDDHRPRTWCGVMVVRSVTGVSGSDAFEANQRQETALTISPSSTRWAKPCRPSRAVSGSTVTTGCADPRPTVARPWRPGRANRRARYRSAPSARHWEIPRHRFR